MKQKPCNRWGCTHTHTHTHTDSFYLKEKNNLIYNIKKRITRNLCDSIFELCLKIRIMSNIGFLLFFFWKPYGRKIIVFYYMKTVYISLGILIRSDLRKWEKIKKELKKYD